MDLIAHCRWNGWIINETFDIYRGEGDNISIWFYKSYIFSLYTVLFSVCNILLYYIKRIGIKFFEIWILIDRVNRNSWVNQVELVKLKIIYWRI